MIDDRESNPAILDYPSSILDPSLVLSEQPDIDQPLMRVGGCPARGGGPYRDSSRRSFLKGRLAVALGMDFPLLAHARAAVGRV